MAKELLNVTGNVTAGTTVFQPPRVRDEKGLWQINIASGTAATVKVELYGRASPTAPWHRITQESTADQAVNNTNVTLIDLMPEMTAAVVANTGGAAIKAWLVH